jgi:chemosensory pili system protein ChpE
MTTLILSSIFLGFAYCAPPGGVTAETFRRGAARGFWPALLVQFGSVVGDAAWAALAVTGVAFVVQNPVARTILSLIGVGMLAWLARSALRDAVHPAAPSADAKSEERGDFAVGALLSLGNPYAIGFWAGVSTSIFASVEGGPQWIHYLAFFAAFLAVMVFWCFLVAGLVAWGRRFLTPNFFRGVNLVCGLALGGFAIQLGWKLVSGWLVLP